MEIPVASDGRMHIALRAVWCHRPLGPSMGSQPKALPFLLFPEGWGKGCSVQMEPGWQLVFQSRGGGQEVGSEVGAVLLVPSGIWSPEAAGKSWVEDQGRADWAVEE